jgi:hypothetical protein
VSRENIVLLTTWSRESRSKMRQYAAAAAELGLDVREEHPDRRTAGVIACSDHRAVDAAWLCHKHGIPGSDPVAATVATNKSLAYSFIESRGFRTLRWEVPLSEADLRDGLRKPVIVKPDRGSGSRSDHPWGYQAFRSAKAFLDYLRRTRQLQAFLDYQRAPSHWWGRYLLMEYVPGRLYGVAAAIADGRVAVYDTHGLATMPDSMLIETTLFGEQHEDMRAIARIAEAFAALGLRRTVLYTQCVARGGRLYPIDFNLRPGTMFDLLVGVLRLPFYAQALSFFLGRHRKMRFRWPSRYLGARRMHLPLRPGRRKVSFGPGAIPVVSEFHYDPRKPYDSGHALPIFAVRCTGRRDFDRRSRAVIARTVIHAARRPGSR